MNKIKLILSSNKIFSIKGNRLYTENRDFFQYKQCNGVLTIEDIPEKVGHLMYLGGLIVEKESPLHDIVEEQNFNNEDDSNLGFKVNSIKFPDVIFTSISNLSNTKIDIMDNVLI